MYQSTISKWQILGTFCLLMLLTMLLGVIAPMQAATTNPSPGSPGYMVIPVTFSRTVTAVSTVQMARLKMPFPAAVVSVTTSCETADYASTDEVYTVNVKEGATSILSSAITLTAADTVYQGTVSDAALTDEAVVTIELGVAGTTPSVTDVTTLLVLKRL